MSGKLVEFVAPDLGHNRPMLPDLTSINLFLRTVHLRNLSKAAAACNMSISAASRRLAALEHHFRTPLLERFHNGVVPTPAGSALAKHAQSLLRAVEVMQADLSDYAQGAVGRVRLYANTSAMSQDLPDQLELWSRMHPDVKLEVHEVRSNEILKAVLNGTADVGIVTSVPIPELRFEPYCLDRLCAVVSKSDPITSHSMAFAELLERDFVGLDDSAAITQRLRDEAAAAGKVPRLRVQVQSFEAACRLVAAGQGVSVLPRGAADVFRHAMKLRFVDLTDTWADRQMYVCVKKGQIPKATRLLVDHLLGSRGEQTC